MKKILIQDEIIGSLGKKLGKQPTAVARMIRRIASCTTTRDTVFQVIDVITNKYYYIQYLCLFIKEKKTKVDI